MNCNIVSSKYDKRIEDIAEHSRYIKDVKKQLEEEEAQLVASLQQTKANEFQMAKVLKGLQSKSPGKTLTNLESKTI